MVLNMDTELQRLICVSVEKMTREPGGGGARKGRGLDLRKALLVAHVLQDMRSSYISDDYKILVNTVCPELKLSSENSLEKLKRTVLRKEYEDLSHVLTPKKRKFFSDDWTSGAVERPPRSESDDAPFMTSPYRCPSSTQSCLLTCSDATMSKRSQITHPIPVSINTSYILSHQTSEKDSNDETPVVMEEDTPAVSEQVEVTSSDDVDSVPIVEEVVQCVEVETTDQKSPELIPQCNTVMETDSKQTQEKIRPSVSCPLPRKKRPLPKEFLEPEGVNSTPEQESKRTKVEMTTVTSSPCDVTVSSPHCSVAVTSSSCYLHNTTTATTLTQSTALSSSHLASASRSSSTSTSPCSTATSSVYTTTLVSSSTICSFTNSKPKVVVEMMNKQPAISGLWSWTLPPTCTQPRLSRCLADGVYRAQLADISNIRENSIHTIGLVAY